MQYSILVVEDDETIRTNLIQLLSFEGYKAEGAADGDEGLQIAVKNRPDLIICDVAMPKMDGFQVLESLRQEPDISEVPFLFLTARSSRQDIRHGMTLGADDYITKPFSDSEILDAVSVRLKKYHKSDEDEGEDDSSEENGVPRVLVFKDNQIVMRFVEQAVAFSSPDAELVTVSNLADLETQLETHKFSLAIVDEGGPEKTGIRAVQKLRAQAATQSLPVLMIISADKPQAQHMLPGLNVRWFVSRPIDLEVLQKTLISAFQSLIIAGKAVKKKLRVSSSL